MNIVVSDLFKYNRSTLFLLGTVGLDVKKTRGYGLCNCYLRDENKPEYEGLDVLFLLFEVKSPEKFRFFVEKEKSRTSLFIDEYDYEGDFVVLVYEIPNQFTEDLEKFKKGQFSKFSKEFIKTLPEKVEVVVNGRKEILNSVQHMIVHKDPEFKEVVEDDLNYVFEDDQEIWTIPDMDEECITIPPKKRIP